MMITRKTRTLSIIAAIAMLVSMFACFVIPASADDLAELLAPYIALRGDVGATAVPNLDAAIAAATGTTTAADLDAELADDVTAGTIDWSAVQYVYGEKDYPRFDHHTVYEAAGYDCLNWSISDPADWDEMDAVANAAAPDANYVDADGNYFDGVTFHLTGDINFGKTARYPLGLHQTVDQRIFAGTIDGHGFGFDINIGPITKTETIYGSSLNGSVGLIGFLGDCTIKDFGINSGTITQSSANSAGSVSTFGCVVANTEDTAPTFERVWSGATVKCITNLHATALAGIRGSTVAAVKVNGFVFDGILAKTNTYPLDSDDKNSVRNSIYGVYGSQDVGPADGSEFYNIISNPTNNSALKDPVDENGNPTAQGNLSYLFGFSTKEAFVKAVDTDKRVQNVFGLSGIANTYRVGKTRPGGGATIVGGGDTAKDYNMIYSGSALEAAWTINSNPTDTDPVYFTLNDEGKIRFGTKETRIVRIDVTSNAEESAVAYAAAGSKIHLKDLGVMVGAGSTAVVNDGAVAVENQAFIVPSSDVTVVIEHDRETQVELFGAILQELIDKYETYEPSLFSDPDALIAFIEDGKKAIENKDLDEIKLIISLESELDLKMVRYPTYSQYDEMKDKNPENNWAISSKEDWLAMVEDSAEDTTITFEGMKFHLTQDIDFGDVPMKPLCYGGVFLGSIDGHGYGFDNVRIDETVIDPSKQYLGLIYQMDAGTLRNFGINSGAIDSSKVECGNYFFTAALLGYSDKTNNTDMLVIEKCWNGANVDGAVPKVGGSAAALLSSGVNNIANNKYFIINGFLNTGNITNHSTSTGELYTAVITTATCYHYHRGIFNSLNTGTITGVAYDKGALPDPGKGACFMRVNAGVTPDFENNASLGDLELFYYSPTTAGLFPTYYNGFTDVAKAAYTLNQGNSGLKDSQGDDVTPVYYTLKDGKIAFGADDGSDQVRKITFESRGTYIGEMYGAAGSMVKLVCDSVVSFDEVIAGASSTLYTSEGELALGNEDVTIEVSTDTAGAIRVQTGIVQELMAKYEGLNTDEFANGEEIVAWKAAAQKAIDEQDLNGLYLAEENEAVLAEGTVLREDFRPTFTQYEKYAKYNKHNNWLIDSVADWKAVMAAANAATGSTYFDNTTFHLTHDIDFSETEWLTPIGVGKFFNGTINGHGFGFDDYKVAQTGSTGTYAIPSDEIACGLFYRLGNCHFIDFGINSGELFRNGGNSSTNVSTFGGLYNGYAPTFTRVWSGAKLRNNSSGYASALVGLVSNTAYTGKTAGAGDGIVVNGFYFDGIVSWDHASSIINVFTVAGSHAKNINADNSFYNVVADGQGTYNNSKAGGLSNSSGAADATVSGVVDAESTSKTAMFGTGGAPANLANVYGISKGEKKIDGAYLSDSTTVAASDKIVVDDTLTAIDAAWRINNNPTDVETDGAEPVYFTLVKGKLRPTADATKQIRRVIVKTGDGAVVETLYKLPGEQVTINVATATGYALTEGTLSTLEGNVLTLGNENVVITAATCEHADVSYSFIEGTKTHNVHCNDCGKDEAAKCKLSAWAANDDLVIAGGAVTAGTHSAACTKCGGVQTQNCVGTLVPHATDCTLDGTITFNCCNREDVLAVGSAKAEHTHNGRWTEVGAPEGKEIDKCEYCDAKLVRTIGKVDVSTGNMVAAGEEVGVVVTLPIALNSAEIKIAPVVDSKYTIQGVAAENATLEAPATQDGIYTATLKDVQAGATITVTVKVEQFGFVEDGLLDVEITNAKNAEGDVSDASAQAQISLARLEGDANADGSLTIKDALAVLQSLAGQPVQIHTANADMDNNGDINAIDAAMIVREWMLIV